MDNKQALEIAQTFNRSDYDICDRCGSATTAIYGWAGYEALCMACFIEENLEHDIEGFADALQQVSTAEDLLALCEEYSF